MLSLKNWNKDTPARLSLLIKTLTGIPVIITMLANYPNAAVAIAIIGAVLDIFAGKKPNSNEPPTP